MGSNKEMRRTRTYDKFMLCLKVVWGHEVFAVVCKLLPKKILWSVFTYNVWSHFARTHELHLY